MDRNIQHHFLTTAHDINDLFDGTTKLSQFKRKLEKQATQNVAAYPFEQYIGDGFEFLVELIIKLSPADNRIGITNYKPVPNNNDNGVDGYGINLRGNPCAVQVKYRVDSNKVLTAGEDRLDSFITESVLEDILPEKTDKVKNHYVFTTAKGLHYYTDGQKFRGTVKCFGNEELRELLDNNIHFWEECRLLIAEDLSKKKSVKT